MTERSFLSAHSSSRNRGFGGDRLKRAAATMATVGAAVLGAGEVERGYQAHDVARLRSQLDTHMTTMRNATRFSLAEHPNWALVAQGTLERPDDRRSLEGFREYLRKHHERAQVLEVAITDRAVSTVDEDKPIAQQAFTLREPPSVQEVLNTLEELAPREYRDMARQSVSVEVHGDNPAYVGDQACRELINVIRLRTAVLPRRLRADRTKGEDGVEHSFAAREERAGIRRFYDYPLTSFGEEREVAAVYNNDSVSYLRGTRVTVDYVQLPSGEITYRGRASAEWIHDTGRRFRSHSQE